MDNLVYRTDDDTRWGSGQGSDLNADQVDINFWTLFSAVLALQEHQTTNAQIVGLHAVGDQMWVILDDDSSIGPITIPTSQWTYRKEGWLPNTVYNAFDVFTRNGSTYLVLLTHTSAATFDPDASDGSGHDLYGLLLENPANALPDGGTAGQRLAKSSGSPYKTEWIDDLIRLAPQCLGAQPEPNELIMQYIVVDRMTLPAGLEGSVAYQGIPTQSAVSWTLARNGTPIGSIDFDGPSPSTVSVTFAADVDCVPGDIITLNAPSTPDAVQADVSFTIIALLRL